MTRVSAAADVVVIGGGVAGLSVVAALAEQREARVLLLEREAELASHASGNNAAIFRPLEDDATSAALAQRSAELVKALEREREPAVYAFMGLALLSASAVQVEELARRARKQGVQHELLGAARLARLDPALDGGEATSGLLLPGGGDIELEALIRYLARAARDRGAELRMGQDVARILTAAQGARVTGVELRDGTRIEAEHVVIAAGAWGEALGAQAGSQLVLTPMRRHLAIVREPSGRASPAPPAATPVIWRLDDEVYYRRAPQGLVASPCDATPWAAGPAELDPAAVALLSSKLGRLAPSLRDAPIERAWACLRTFATDGELVAGPDAEIAGLHWLAGLGGRGMSVAPAAGELVARRIAGAAPDPLALALAPNRGTLRNRVG